MKLIAGLPPEAKTGERICLDVETFGQPDGKVHRPTGTFACLSVNLERDVQTVYQIYDEKDVSKLLTLMKKGVWVLHNALYDLTQLRRFSTIKPRFIWDTMLVEQATFGGYYTFFGLKDMARRWLNVDVDKETREHFSTTTEMTPKMKKYAADDVVYTLQIALKQYEEFNESPRLRAYTEIDEPMIFPLLDIKGIRVDVGAWEKSVEEFQRIAKQLEEELGFNVYSPIQVKNNLKKHKLYLQDTAAETLKEHENVPVVAQILQARMYRKAVSTYGLKWLESNVEADGKVYPSWHITGANTGRMSSSNPNGQNIPARKLPVYRTFFIPSNGHVMTVEDVVQQEPCILAFESQDKVLLEAVARGEDLHQAIADAIHQPRSIGKAINLGIGYGLTAQGLAARIPDISLSDAESIISQYFNRFRGVFQWISATRNFAYSQGYVQTVSKRRVHINPYDIQWQNNAINSPIQGGAADFTKRWVRNFWEESGDLYSLCLIVHDEIVKDPDKKYLKETNEMSAKAFHRTAEELFPKIPFRFDREVGKSWGCKTMKEEIYESEEEPV